MPEGPGGAESHRVAVSGDVEVGTYLEIAEAVAQLSGGSAARHAPSVPPAETPVARESIAILDFGSQYSQLIARRVRECHVYCELLPHDVDPERVHALNPCGFILSGGRPVSMRAGFRTLRGRHNRRL